MAQKFRRTSLPSASNSSMVLREESTSLSFARPGSASAFNRGLQRVMFREWNGDGSSGRMIFGENGTCSPRIHHRGIGNMKQILKVLFESIRLVPKCQASVNQERCSVIYIPFHGPYVISANIPVGRIVNIYKILQDIRGYLKRFEKDEP